MKPSMNTAVLMPQIPCLYLLFKEIFYVFSKARLTVCDLLLVSTNSKLSGFYSEDLEARYHCFLFYYSY